MLQDIIVNIGSSLIFLFFGYLFGIYLEKKKLKGKNLDEYEFYPFDLDDSKALHFNYDTFNQAVTYFLKKSDPIAAKQLVIIGNQHNVIHELNGKDKKAYQSLFKKYHGQELLEDTVNYLENYKRIVDLLGDTFPDMGIEILLHNLSNPGKALYHIKNNVTGRNIDAPATNLVLDLKTRKIIKQSKLNYELNIGSRKFKCTTIPIYRENYGLVGAICINVDTNYISNVIKNDNDMQTKFFEALCRTDMQLNENILSKLEYEKAKNGKKHFRDFNH